LSNPLSFTASARGFGRRSKTVEDNWTRRSLAVR
jgi:hypothetical protein